MSTRLGEVHTAPYQELLRRLRAARERAGFTQEEVAKSLRRPQSFVSKCESGERRIDAIELRDFLAIYGLKAGPFVDSLPGKPRRRSG